MVVSLNVVNGVGSLCETCLTSLEVPYIKEEVLFEKVKTPNFVILDGEVEESVYRLKEFRTNGRNLPALFLLNDPVVSNLGITREEDRVLFYPVTQSNLYAEIERSLVTIRYGGRWGISRYSDDDLLNSLVGVNERLKFILESLNER